MKLHHCDELATDSFLMIIKVPVFAHFLCDVYNQFRILIKLVFHA